jgi:hypothetical protein
LRYLGFIAEPEPHAELEETAQLCVAAAFAQERDASYAVRLMTTTSTEIRYTLRRVVGEDGDIQMVVLEATFDDPDLGAASRPRWRAPTGWSSRPKALAAAKAS